MELDKILFYPSGGFFGGWVEWKSETSIENRSTYDRLSVLEIQTI